MTWANKPYPGGAMVKVKGFPRKLDVDAKPHPGPGPDVQAYMRTVSRAGRWKWDTPFPDDFTVEFARGIPAGKGGVTKETEVLWSGVAGVQAQSQGQVAVSGIIGEKTFNYLRSIRIPEGLPHAGEPAMDKTAADLINDAFDKFKGSGAGSPREKAMSHMSKRVGYTEQPANSNSDNRSDGIRTSQRHTAGGGTWLDYQPWCGCWCYYALESAGVAKIDSHLASVASIEDAARAGSKCYRGWTTDRSKIKKGDLVIVGGYGVHVEMVRGAANSDGSVPTYGGNTSSGSSGSQSNGGGAYKRTRYASEIRGFALVRFPGE
jgi:hypothetical protein